MASEEFQLRHTRLSSSAKITALIYYYRHICLLCAKADVWSGYVVSSSCFAFIATWSTLHPFSPFHPSLWVVLSSPHLYNKQHASIVLICCCFFSSALADDARQARTEEGTKLWRKDSPDPEESSGSSSTRAKRTCLAAALRAGAILHLLRDENENTEEWWDNRRHSETRRNHLSSS